MLVVKSLTRVSSTTASTQTFIFISRYCDSAEKFCSFVLCFQTSQRVCIKQPSLARSLIQDSQSELLVAGGHVQPECKVVELRTQLPFFTTSLTITARYVYLCTFNNEYTAQVILIVACAKFCHCSLCR